MFNLIASSEVTRLTKQKTPKSYSKQYSVIYLKINLIYNLFNKNKLFINKKNNKSNKSI
jgi:hypothetical protein